MRPGLPMIHETVHISRHFKWHETNLHITENACCVDYADTWSSKQVHWLSNGQCMNCSTTYSGCENTVAFETALGWVSLQITRIHLWVAEHSQIQRLPATLHNTGWLDDRQVWYSSFEAIPILDPVDFETAYTYSAQCHHGLQWPVQWYGWDLVSFG